MPGAPPGARPGGVRQLGGAEAAEAAVEGRETLLTEGVLPKFLRYVRIDTQSDPGGADVPTTAGQWRLSRLLAAECTALGLADVAVDAHGIVTATLPANLPRGRPLPPVIGLLAHLDTSPAVSGRGVRPIVHRAYRGGPLALPAGPVLDPADHPALAEAVGLDIVTSDGSTLLGADDKAGVAAIMAACARLLQGPAVAHGALRIGFTTDEETGRGIEFLDVEAFGASCAYTVDGGALGDVSWENFEAENVTVAIEGRSSHTGTARGRMCNAVALAAALAAAVPADRRPETADGRSGFIHVDAIDGNVESARVVLLLRDFEQAGLRASRAWLDATCAALRAGHPACRVEVRRTGGYRNMRGPVERRPEVVERALQAMRAAGVTPRPSSVRGGTDGARLSERGLPTPNLFAGGMDFHSRTEWVPVQWMEKAAEVLVALARLWAGPEPADPGGPGRSVPEAGQAGGGALGG